MFNKVHAKLLHSVMIIKLNFKELNTDKIRTQFTVFDKHNQIK